MFAKLTTKIALKKAGIPSSFSVLTFTSPAAERDGNKLQAHKKASSEDNIPLAFSNPLQSISLPNTWNTWSTPPPPPVDVASTRPSAGSSVLALGRETREKLCLGDGRACLVVFLRWCGCPCTCFILFLSPCISLLCAMSLPAPSTPTPLVLCASPTH